MDTLPIEILERILTLPTLRIRDVINISCTSKYFRYAILNNSYIWKAVFARRWPQLVKIFSSDYEGWLNEIQLAFRTMSKMRPLLFNMSTKCYKTCHLSYSDFLDWIELIETSPPRAQYYILHTLNTSINTYVPINSRKMVSLEAPGNLTLQFYSAKVLRFIRHCYITKQWSIFSALPVKQQTLEKAAVLIANWCQPSIDIELESISEKLSILSDRVLKCLKFKYPNHPVLTASKEDMEKWKNENLERNQWDVSQSKQIVECLKMVIYEQSRFKGIKDDSIQIPQYCYINIVLNKKVGHPILLGVIYESVARRLGLKCVSICLHNHYFLKFCIGDESKGDTYYVDVFHNGNIVYKSLCPYSRDIADNVFYAKEVAETILYTLEQGCVQPEHPNENITHLRSVLELECIISPTTVFAATRLAYLYMYHNIDPQPLQAHIINHKLNKLPDMSGILQMLREFKSKRVVNPNKQPTLAEPKIRSTNLKYAVGMIMKHKVYNYTCVIYDWDHMCTASKVEQMKIRVHELKFVDSQPFYKVLVEDQSYQYVAQENLIPTSDRGNLEFVDDVGRYFSHFFENHYVPNIPTQHEFPEDTPVRYHYHLMLKFGNSN